MQIKKTEIAVIGLTVAFVFFLLGYFTGQSGAKGTFDVKTRLSPEKTSVNTQIAQTDISAAPTVGPVPTGMPSSIAPAPSDSSSNPETPQASEATQGEPAEETGALVDINTADIDGLMTLPGIGEVLAGRIMEYRSVNGAFKQIEDIMYVKGIGEKTFEGIRDLITVG
jgi:competence ComEA-like helix-hairpin-helix protein